MLGGIKIVKDCGIRVMQDWTGALVTAGDVHLFTQVGRPAVLAETKPVSYII